MKVLHIVSALDPRSGGPTRSVKGLCRAIGRGYYAQGAGHKGRVKGAQGTGHNGRVKEEAADAGEVEVTLFAHDPRFDFENPGAARYLTGKGTGLLTVWRETGRILDEVKPDIVHLHCLWGMSTHIGAVQARRRGIPYIIAPRGMLEPWSLNAKKWKKRVALWLYQRRDLRGAAALHATAESEAEQLRRLGFTQEIVVSPNGVELPDAMPARTERADGKKVALFLSRIHPKKGLLELVEAWAVLLRSSSDPCISPALPMAVPGLWHVEYAGPDYDGHLAEVRRRIAELGLEEHFTYLGDLDDAEKWRAYRRADLFVLPTHSENFGIVVAEALAAGVPVITTKGAPWEVLRGYYAQGTGHNGRVKGGDGDGGGEAPPGDAAGQARSGWWVDIGVEPLAQALWEAMALTDEERAKMGANGQRLVAERFRWEAIGAQMAAAYRIITPRGLGVMGE